MATNIKDLSSHQRENLIQELSEKLIKKSFLNDKEKENAIKLLNMLSKHEPKEEPNPEDSINVELNFD